MMTPHRRRGFVALVSLGLVLGGLFRVAGPHRRSPHLSRAGRPAVAPVDYARDIKPILEARCCRCHGPTRHKAGLRLDTAQAICKGGAGGAVIVPGNSADSVLIAAVSGAEGTPHMPPSGEPLTRRQIGVLRAWIDVGAPAPYHDEPGPAADCHWAFRPPERSAVPAVPNADETRNPIDAFLAAGHAEHGLTPSPPVDRGLWLRRVYIDLIGLPPTQEELHAYLADRSPDADDKVVDRLLASPQYGERWGRHWMDVWRYSDPDGRKAKNDIWWSNEHIWRWRDWILRSLNHDTGYDRMVVEMLAGDEAAPGDPEALAATGFLVRNWFKLNRHIGLNHLVEHTGKAFLGLTIGCARCHDHKFDPVTQQDYYRFRAFFEPHDIRTDRVQAEDGRWVTVAHAYDAHPEAPTWVFVRGDERTPDRSTLITPGVPAALGGPVVQITLVGTDGGSTGRRLALARWLVDRRNPLTARVAVNHVWARHFGWPLVENVQDFGRRGSPPAQQPLLDWLAVEFMAHDWRLKWLHRLIVTSAAYRREGLRRGASAANLTADPDNRYLWRADPRRMEAEVVRDALLYLSGELDFTLGGPPLDCQAGADFARRSLYHRYSRDDKLEFLTAFDAAGVEECYRRRESIVPQQALALANSDFVWGRARRITRRLEKALAPSAGDVPPGAFVTAAFEHLLGRGPTPAERAAGEQFLARQEQLLADPARLTPFPPPPPPAPPDPDVIRKVPGLPLTLGVGRKLSPPAPAHDPAGRAREYLIHALLNHNDFITIR